MAKQIGLLNIAGFNTRILAYHTANPQYFEKQMDYLRQNYKVVSLQEALKDLDRKQVVLTFDDGYRNNLECAYPVLKRLGLKATIFITYDFIQKNSFAWWDRLAYSGAKCDIRMLKSMSPDQIEKRVTELTGLYMHSKKPHKYDFLSWSEVARILDVFDIGSHTLSHPILTNIPSEQAEEEIADSRKMIKEKIKKEVMSLAYPNGNCNEQIMDAARQAGYNCAVIYEKGNNSKKADLFRLYRRGINFDDDLEIFAAKTAGVF